MKKRLLAIILAVVMAMSLLPMSALAAGDGSAGSSQQIKTGEEAYLTYYDKEDAEIDSSVVPGTQKGTSSSSEKTMSDGVKLSKTISGTDTENVFRIDLSVTTSEKVSEFEEVSGANVVLVFDVSTSMDWTITGKEPGEWGWNLADTRWTALKAAADKFIDMLLPEGNSKNQVSIVVYGGHNVDKSGVSKTDQPAEKTLVSWTTSAAEAKAAYNQYAVVSQSTIDAANLDNDTSCLRKSVFGDTGTYFGATNCQAGFRAADAALSSLNTINPTAYSDNANYVVYMSDGDANRYYKKGKNDWSYTTSEGIPTTDDTNENAVKGAQAQAKVLKENHQVTLYTIGFGTTGEAAKKVLMPQYTSGKTTYTGNEAVDEYFDAADAGALEFQFENIVKRIKVATEAWTVDDPLSQYVDFKSYGSSASCFAYDEDSDSIKWDLKKDTSYTTTTDQETGVTSFTYTRSYIFELDNLNYDVTNYVPTNNATKLVYALHTGDLNELDTEVREAYFNVPQVKGLSGTLEFTKVNPSSESLAGAEFKLTTSDSSSWKAEVTSDANGQVTFSNIPSGHSYTLTETAAPDGYQEVSEINFDVSYGEIKNVESTGAAGAETTKRFETTSGTMTLVDPSETGSLTISKAFAGDDANEIQKQFEDPDKVISFEVNIDGKTVSEVTLPKAETENGVTTYTWSTTIDDLAPGNYTVTESGADVNGYDLVTTGTSATVTAGSTATMTVTNTYDKHESNVTVSKELVSIGGAPAGANDNNKVAGEGQEIVWKITVTNSGKAEAKDLTLTDLLNGAENEKVTITPNEGTVYNEGSKTFNVSANGGKAEFTAKYTVTDADAGETLTNSVTVGDKNDSADSVYTFVKDIVTSADAANLPEEVTSALTAQNLTPTYPANDNDPVYLNEDDSVTLLYAITVTGEEDTAYTITDADAVFVVQDSETGKIPESGTVTVYVAKTFNAANIDESTGKVTNTATLTAGGETDTAAEETDVLNIDVVKEVTAVGDTQVTDQNDVPMAQKDDVITWTITVTNNSKVAASGLKLSDSLEDVTVTDTNTVLDANDEFSLEPGASATFTATYTVTQDDVGTVIVNAAVVKNGDAIVEEDASEGVTVGTMSISKTVVTSKDSVPTDVQANLEGKTITYPTSQLSIKASDEVTLLYKIEVTGIEGQTYTISDDKATFLTEAGGSSYAVSIPTDNDAGITGSVTVYVIRTFKASDIQDGNLTNVATMTDSNGKNVTDTENTPAQQESTPKPPIPPVKPSKPPVLNTEDHYGYIVGYPDGTVRPEGTITRAEVATIFFRLLTDESRSEYWSQTSSYSDVSASDWFNNAVCTLANAGIITGYEDGTFRPNGTITRAEFATIASRFFEYADEASENPFTDVDENAWYYEYVMAASGMGLINGYPDGTFGPTKSITRAEAVTIVNRTLDRHPDKDHLLDGMLVWSDNMDTTQWYYADVQEATNSHEYVMQGSGDSKYENWTEILEVRDWAAYEKAWSDANSASGADVMR